MEVPTFNFASVWEAAARQKQAVAAAADSSAMASTAAVPCSAPGSPVDLSCMSFESLFPSVGPSKRAGSDVDVVAQLSNQLSNQAPQHSPIVPDQSALLLMSVAAGIGVVPGSGPAASPTTTTTATSTSMLAHTASYTLPHSALTPPPTPSQDDLLPEYTGPLPSSFHELTEVQIATVSFKNFTKLMAKSKLNDRQVHEAKKLRRRVKNRVSARLCSTRKRVKCTSTESSNQLLAGRLAHLSTHNENLLNQHMLLQERCIELQKNEAQLTREKLYAEAECTRLRDLLKQATDAGLLGNHGVTPGLYANAA